MFIRKELKLNRFRVVNIPENKSYFQRFGNRIVESSLYSGDQEFAPRAMRKDDLLSFMDERDRQLQYEQSQSDGEDS